MNNFSILAMCLLLMTPATAFSAAGTNVKAEGDSEVSHWGEAKTDDGKLVYKEKHTAYYKDGQIYKSVSDYFDGSDKKIATMESRYEKSVAMPTYFFEDFRRNYKEGLAFEDGKYVVFNQEDGKKRQSEALEDVSNVFSCQGWHYFLVQNLEKLEGKDPLELKLILPSRLDAYEFRIRKLGETGNEMKVKLELNSWLLRMIAPDLELVYAKDSRQLLRYRGVSNIFDDEGETQTVNIVYKY